ncbi:MAG: hypothetical protein KIT16_00280 [Rhodospirillaceae bacterium]|nr:hypothetical protein [Rhodospirillaceae bacterium]
MDAQRRQSGKLDDRKFARGEKPFESAALVAERGDDASRGRAGKQRRAFGPVRRDRVGVAEFAEQPIGIPQHRVDIVERALAPERNVRDARIREKAAESGDTHGGAASSKIDCIVTAA